LAGDIKINGNDILYLIPPEIKELLKTGDASRFKKIIEARKKLCVTTNIYNSYQLYTGEKANKLLKKYLPKKPLNNSAQELRGVSASSGRATGKVRIILLDKDFIKFKKGEILVSYQTMVKYLPLMKKSAAILTQYGGLTSHAAIVSRELHKPCIVGINNLTQILKNGDWVEVDANNGIIRKLK
jgi:phosphoenolpyruvate synthase/pyruvate phosphate dikinase